MTMLYSFYSREGIIFAADSRITRPGSSTWEPPQRKVQRVTRAGENQGLVGYYGLAKVGERPMATWLASLIANWPGSHSPTDFADLLVQRLNRDVTTRQRRVVSGLHFGAFRRAGGRIEPTFFHIRNTYDFDVTTGTHTNLGDYWQEEQFMGRDVPNTLKWQPRDVRRRLAEFQRLTGMPYWYRNGDLPMFVRVTDHLQSALREVSRLPGYATPSDLHSWERIARSMVITTSQVGLALYQGPIPSIGDEARVLSVPWPQVGH